MVKALELLKRIIKQIVQQVAAQLTGCHFESMQRQIFHMKNAAKYGWFKSILIMQIETALHKRQVGAVTNFKDKLPSPQSDLVHYMLKGPYYARFLNYEEKQMTAQVKLQTGASSTYLRCNPINWNSLERNVRQLQMNIKE